MKLGYSISVFCLLSIRVFISTPSYSQVDFDYKTTFLEAESYFLFEEYKEALPYYMKLTQQYPNNFNIQYKIGVCYLNNPFKHKSAIPYLEKAVKHMSEDAKEDSHKETMAPLDALFYLGDAYLVNNMLDKAKEAFKQFKTTSDPNIYDYSLVDKKIENCNIAKKLQKQPVFYEINNLGSKVNTRFADERPILSGDGNTLVFTTKLAFYDAVFYCTKENGEWTYPINLTPSFQVDGNTYTTGLSFDGTELYVYRSDEFDGNIYVSKLSNGNWSKLEKLNDNINTKYWESHASPSADGKTLYFTSNRKGSNNESLDIYYSKRTSGNNWGPAKSISPNINSPYNEDTPFITEDGKTIYFSSAGHYNMGWYDIFYSDLLEDGTWSVPLNAGYPINTTGDNTFFVPYQNGIYGVYSLFKPEGYGLTDIYLLEIFSDIHPRKFILSGKIILSEDLSDVYSGITMEITNLKTEETAKTFLDKEGNYNTEITSGEFNITFDGEHIEKITRQISIALNSPNKEISQDFNVVTKPPSAPPSKIIEPEKPNLQIPKKYLSVEDNELVSIEIMSDKNAHIDIVYYLNNQLILTDSILTKKEKTIYSIEPHPGNNKLVFSITNEDSQTVTQTVLINYVDETSEEIAEDIDAVEIFEENLNPMLQGILPYCSETLMGFILNSLDDMERKNIISLTELYAYLIKNEPNQAYSINDVNDFYIHLLTQKDTETIWNELYINASDSVLQTLLEQNRDSLLLTKHAHEFLTILKNYYDFENISPLSFYKTTHAISLTNDSKELEQQILTYYTNGLFSSEAIKAIYLNKEESYRLENYLNEPNPDIFVKEEDNSWIFFSRILSDYHVSEYYEMMLLNAEGSLLNELLSTNLSVEKIFTSPQLLSYLFDISEQKDFTIEDVIQTLEKAKSGPQEKELIYTNMLSFTNDSTWKNIIREIDYKKYHIEKFNDLIKHLLYQGHLYNITNNDLYKLVASTCTHMKSNELVEQLIFYSDSAFATYLHQLDISQFKDNQSLLAYLFNQAKKGNIDIDSFIDAIFKTILKNKSIAEIQTKDLFNKPVLIVSGLLVVLIIILIVYFRKKEKVKT